MPRWVNQSERKEKADSGAAGIEFALLLPILILLTFGITELGRLMLHQHTIQKSVRDAGRYLSRVGDVTAEEDNAKSIVLRGSLDSSAPLLLSYFTGAASSGANSIQVVTDSVDNAAGEFRGGETLYVVKVTAVVPFSSILLNLIGLPENIPFQAHHEERYIGN